MQKSRSCGVDTLKAICAFLVVSIHAKTSLWIGEYLVCIARIAVPIFFMITGFYYSNSRDRQKKQLIKMAKLYIIAQIAYCMYDILLKVVIPNRIGTNFSVDDLLDYLLFNQTTPDSNHLWYLIALIYVLILVRLFNDKLSIKYKIIIMSLCFLLSLGLGAYSGIFFGHALPERYTMNFLFTGLPFFLLGELLSNAYERKSGWMRNQSFLLACSLISFLLMIFEREIVYSLYPDAPQNIYAFTILSSVTVFLYFMSCKGNWILGSIGKDHSSTIYIVHMMVYMTLSIVTNVLGVNYLFSVIAPVIVFGVSLTYSIIWQRVKRFVLRRTP